MIDITEKENKMNEHDLKRCPFCGCDGEIVSFEDGRAYARCISCRTQCPNKISEKVAATFWNNRAPEKVDSKKIKFKWEFLELSPLTKRAKVIGGWLVHVEDRTIFVTDPLHSWEI